MQGKSKNQDTSALFSLQEIMRLEAERELEERAKADRLVQDEQKAREREEELARQREQERMAAVEAERAAEERRRREEEVRLQAIREAERERARAEAEHAGRLQALHAQQQHEQALAALGRDKSKRRAKWIAILSVSLLVIASVAGGIVLRAQMRRTAELEGSIAGLQAEIEHKQSEMAQTTSPEKRKELEDQLAALQGQVDALKTGKTAAPPQPKAPAPVQARQTTQKKDDVCEEIKKNPNDPRRYDPTNGCL